MFGIPGKGVVKGLETGLAKGNDLHRVACEQRFVLGSSLLPLSFDLHADFLPWPLRLALPPHSKTFAL